MLVRHDFSAEQDVFYCGRRPIVQSVKHADQAQSRYCPDHCRNLVIAQPVQQLRRFGKKTLGRDDQCSSRLCGGIDILHRNIKIKGSLICKDLLLIKSEQAHKILNEVDDGTMGDDNAFRYACGAGGKVGIQWIGVDHTIPDRLKGRSVDRLVRQVLHQQDPIPGDKALGNLHMKPVRYHIVRPQDALDLFQARDRQIRVEENVIPSGIYDPPKGG